MSLLLWRHRQEMLFQTHLRVAAEVEVPVIIHMVQSAERIAELAGQEESLPAAAVFHYAVSLAQYTALSSTFRGRLFLVSPRFVRPSAEPPSPWSVIAPAPVARSASRAARTWDAKALLCRPRFTDSKAPRGRC